MISKIKSAGALGKRENAAMFLQNLGLTREIVKKQVAKIAGNARKRQSAAWTRKAAVKSYNAPKTPRRGIVEPFSIPCAWPRGKKQYKNSPPPKFFPLVPPERGERSAINCKNTGGRIKIYGKRVKNHD